MNALLIDIGSTFIKWALYDTVTAAKSAVTRVPFPTPSRDDPPYYEVDAEDIFRAVLSIIGQAGRSDSACFSVQMHGYVLGDITGRAITPYVSWQDERASLQKNGSSYADHYPRPIPPESGSSRKNNLPVLSLFAMKSLAPEIYAQARMFFTLGSYIAYRLTGLNITHLTDAAPSGFYNAGAALPSELAIPGIALPLAWRGFAPIGRFIGQHSSLDVCTPVGDQQAAVLGSGLQEDGYLLNLGTAAQLCALSKRPVFGDYESRPFFGGQTLCTVTRLPGGRDIQRRMAEHSDLTDMLVQAYRQAMQRLPPRSRLLVAGGAAQYHRSLISQVCRQLEIPFEILASSDPLDGLITLLSEASKKGEKRDA